STCTSRPARAATARPPSASPTWWHATCATARSRSRERATSIASLFPGKEFWKTRKRRACETANDGLLHRRRHRRHVHGRGADPGKRRGARRQGHLDDQSLREGHLHAGREAAEGAEAQ